MLFFFVRNSRNRYRFFCPAASAVVPPGSSRAKEAWEKAKRKVVNLNPRTLRQEQAFALAAREQQAPVRILHSGLTDDRRLRLKFAFFLQRQRTRHIVVLALEALAVPVTGVAAILPGPNLLFYVLAMIMIIQWQALKGINRLIHRPHEFVADPVLAEWEEAVARDDEAAFPGILKRLEEAHGVEKAGRILL
jgi:hypothetical protein